MYIMCTFYAMANFQALLAGMSRRDSIDREDPLSDACADLPPFASPAARAYLYRGATMSDAAVRVDDLRKSYRSGFWRRRAETLRGISFSVPKGATVGYLGANGVGKTTTLKILVGLLEADSGEVEVLGLPVHDPACRRRVGFLPENPYFYEHLSAREAMAFYGGLSRMGPAPPAGPEVPPPQKDGLPGAAPRPPRGERKGEGQPPRGRPGRA